ncbi:hypothetical protein [Absidia glauca]|uniref:Uncharacterized protein n=1 Tax=Absidia glauca TaxID=4829 RepID=A0A163MNY8_ABSGL|nr:hypothetical protein [Absidia glauca]
MASPSCPKAYKDYKITDNVDISVSRFFRTTPARDWSLPNYCDAHRNNVSATPTVYSLNKSYRSDLAVIKKNKTLPRDIKAYAGYLLDTKAKPETPSASTIIYQGSIVGCHGDTINLTNNNQARATPVGSSSALENDNLDLANDLTHQNSNVESPGNTTDLVNTPTETLDEPEVTLDDDIEFALHNDTLLVSDASTETALLRPLYGYVYSLYKGEKVDVEQLVPMAETSLQARLYNQCLADIKQFDQLDKTRKSFLSVFLSGMINTINLDHRDLAVRYLSKPVLKSILDSSIMESLEAPQDNNYIGRIVSYLSKLYKLKGITGTRKWILKEKMAAIEAKVDIKESTLMIILDILDHILNMVEYSTWTNDETEAEYLDYWKPIFRTLFRGSPEIHLRTGEMACRATKYDRQINELEHGNTRKSVAGRKIDLLVQSVDGDNTFELTSVEFKPMGVSDAIQIVQQNKNLRINKSILSRLIKHVDDPSIGVIGMDVIGLVACMYSVKMYEDVVVAVKLVDIVLPSDMLELDEIMAEGALFPVLLKFKKHIIDLSRKAMLSTRSRKRKRQTSKTTRETTPPYMNNIDVPPTFFTPKR